MEQLADQLSPGQVRSVAERLCDAERSRRPIAPPTDEFPDLSVTDAYRIQREGLAMRSQPLGRVVGAKIGLTSAAMQQQLGVDEPDFGVLLAGMVHPLREPLHAGRLIAPRVEAELAVRLGQDLDGTGDADTALAAIELVCGALEVIDSRVADWRITLADTVADNASAAAVVLGDWWPADEVDLVAETVLLRSGTESSGRGADVLGHPARALAWLARSLAEQGDQLRAGNVVLTGAMGASLPLTAGEPVEARFGSIGVLTVEVVDG